MDDFFSKIDNLLNRALERFAQLTHPHKKQGIMSFFDGPFMGREVDDMIHRMGEMIECNLNGSLHDGVGGTVILQLRDEQIS
jgi:hypothetical protein